MFQSNRTPVLELPWGERPSQPLLKSRRLCGGILLGLLVFASPAVHQAQAQSGPPGSGWVLTFDDEFQGTSLDRNKWVTDSGPNAGFPNSSINVDSALVEGNGYLQIVTDLASPSLAPTAPNTTTGRINTGGIFQQQYGWFECRCKMPPGTGMWPAFWLTGGTGGHYWEVDIFQFYGNHNPYSIYPANIWTDSNGVWNEADGGYTGSADFTADFHTFAVNWQPDSVTFYVDGSSIWKSSESPSQPMWVVVDSGSMGPQTTGGDINGSTPLPNSLVVQYVRVYQGGGTTPPNPPPAPSPSPAPLSPNGSVIYAGQGGSLTTSEGTWTFAGVSGDGVDSVEELNGVANGWATEMEIVNGSLYAHNTYGAGGWYLRQNGTWVNVGPTAP